MKKIIHETYDINPHTIALLPAYQPDCDTIVLEGQQTIYVREPALTMIKRACIEGGATYDGRRLAVAELTRAQNKVPISVDTTNQIYAFPTHSPSKLECIWIFYHHVKSFETNVDQPTKTIVHFHETNSLIADVSYPTFERQMQRTAYCMVKLSYLAPTKGGFTPLSMNRYSSF
ncbi:competence protein ComK [Bacillus sp. FJAT-45037]|uniref:competence protein ComK n=1 Tax=Bacillus sp. FJAT-45037 TaxID=2011007 RepID=UPI000C23FB77|nr:competence protein ComK [Bacillus sp. FJAT-45037]